jgi:hypothetical protein
MSSHNSIESNQGESTYMKLNDNTSGSVKKYQMLKPRSYSIGSMGMNKRNSLIVMNAVKPGSIESSSSENLP